MATGQPGQRLTVEEPDKPYDDTQTDDAVVAGDQTDDDEDETHRQTDLGSRVAGFVHGRDGNRHEHGRCGDRDKPGVGSPGGGGAS